MRLDRHSSQLRRNSNQVTVRPPRRRHPHRTASSATSRSPRPPSALRPAGRSVGTPGPLRPVTSTRITPSPALTATVTVSSGPFEPLCRMLLPNSSLTSSSASAPHGWPGPSTPPTNARATRARSARPASVTVSRTVAPAISAPAFPAALVPGNRAGRRADTGMDARLGGKRQARTPSGTGTGTPSSGYPHRSLAPVPVRYASVRLRIQVLEYTDEHGRRRWERLCRPPRRASYL
jgi:hypothetical protein